MARGKSSDSVRAAVVTLLSILVTCPTAFAQGPFPETPVPAATIEHGATFVPAPQPAISEHKFWERENKLLFAAAAALNGADLAIIRSNLQRGGRELNPVVRMFGRSTRGLAVNFAGETAEMVTLSYLLHKTGHHKLERFVSVANIGASAGAVSYGLAQH